jgi:hypothetical protein
LGLKKILTGVRSSERRGIFFKDRDMSEDKKLKISYAQIAARALAAIAAGSALASCQSLADAPERLPNKTAAALQPASQGLAPRELNRGECGLFIWAGDARTFILFTQNGQSAVLAKDSQEMALKAEPPRVSGDLYGQIPVQNFTDAEGRTYALSLAGEENIDGGIRYSSGTWRYKDSAGWDVLTPVYGLSTCQPLS